MAGKFSPGVIDSEKRRFIEKNDKSEAQRDGTAKYLADQAEHQIYAVNGHINTVDNLVRLGTPMSWQQFESKLLKLPHGDKLIFLDFIRPFRAMCIGVGGETYKISSYGRVPNIPEWSTMNINEKIVPDLSVRHLSYKDFPAMDWTGDRSVGFDNYKTQGGFQTLDGSLKPGWKKVYEMVGENPEDPWSRGWRTNLCLWLQISLKSRGKIPAPSPAEIENVFGTTDSPQWAKHMGKQNIVSPF
jgi:hypothetical protein